MNPLASHDLSILEKLSIYGKNSEDMVWPNFYTPTKVYPFFITSY